MENKIMPEIIYAGIYHKNCEEKSTDGWNIHNHGTKYIRADMVSETTYKTEYLAQQQTISRMQDERKVLVDFVNSFLKTWMEPKSEKDMFTEFRSLETSAIQIMSKY